MHTPHPPRPSYPPGSGSGAAPGESDESLAAQLRARPESGTAHAVAMLLARHWKPARDYAAICLASPADIASQVTTAACHQMLERLVRGESAAALRPRLLVAVGDTVKGWAADPRISASMPELRKPTGGRGMRAAQPKAAESRKLADHSFRALPGAAQCVLWHVEVEAEPISVPAGLLAMDTDSASALLEQARKQFRAGCVRAQRELAPSQECRYYTRLIDVPIRRGGALLPDVQTHLLKCRHCRHAAEQLGCFEDRLGLLLAETVLGWGARRYLDSRPGRSAQGDGVHAGGTVRHGARRPGAGRHRLLPHITASGAQFTPPTRNAKVLLTGLGLVSAALLTAVLATGLSPDHGNGDDAGPAASTAASDSHATAPHPTSEAPPAESTATTPANPTTPAGFPVAPVRTRLRNAAADLCLDIRGGKPKPGALTKLAMCSSALNQQWSYEDDGLLRSLADPELCLDSHADAGLITLATCAGPSAARADDVRYDLTVRGELLPRWDEGLVLAPASLDGDVDVVVKIRNGSAEQRWLLDSPTVAPGSRSISKTPPSPSRENVSTDVPPAEERCTAPKCTSSSPGGKKDKPKEPEEPEASSEEAQPGHYGKRRAEVGGRRGPESVAPRRGSDNTWPLVELVTRVHDRPVRQAMAVTGLHKGAGKVNSEQL
ncbi:RICIN domain-containing protein [Streptomyces sp. NPDC002994]|uniref:RICIN domain-containing protein n=1 Tax=Streptomyces sp. NPDC002994 TaxID=3154441 RepID=UPI0033AA5724